MSIRLCDVTSQNTSLWPNKPHVSHIQQVLVFIIFCPWDGIECAFHWFYMQAKDSVVILYTSFSPHSQNTMEESSRPGEKASLLQKLLSEWTRPRSTFMPFSVWGQLAGEWELLVLWWVVHRRCKSKQRLKSTILPLMFQDDCRVMKKAFTVAQKTTLYIYKYIY